MGTVNTVCFPEMLQLAARVLVAGNTKEKGTASVSAS